MPTFRVEVAAVFAREVLEGCVIIGEYRNAVKAQGWEAPKTNAAFRDIWLAAAVAGSLALALLFGLGLELKAAGGELSDVVARAISGVSELVAAVCIARLSLQFPVWLGVYPQVPEERKLGLARSEVVFNVAWNVLREVVEIGAFLLPLFVGDEGPESVPQSAIVGLVAGLLGGVGVYGASLLLEKSRRGRSFLSGLVTGWLSTGLFAGGCHEIEKVAGETAYAWQSAEEVWDRDRFALAMFEPFGYTKSPTVLWIVSLDAWAILLITAHVAKYQWLKRKVKESGM